MSHTISSSNELANLKKINEGNLVPSFRGEGLA